MGIWMAYEGFGGEEVDHKVDRDVVHDRDTECKAEEKRIVFQIHVMHAGTLFRERSVL